MRNGKQQSGEWELVLEKNGNIEEPTSEGGPEVPQSSYHSMFVFSQLFLALCVYFLKC